MIQTTNRITKFEGAMGRQNQRSDGSMLTVTPQGRAFSASYRFSNSAI
jgi:hypothetical protein